MSQSHQFDLGQARVEARPLCLRYVADGACLAEWSNGPISRYRYVPWPAPRPERCRLGERMGGEHGCAVAELQVSEVSSGLQGSEVMFEFYASTSAPGSAPGRIRTCAHGSGGISEAMACQPGSGGGELVAGAAAALDPAVG